jgi:hypothetical protein
MAREIFLFAILGLSLQTPVFAATPSPSATPGFHLPRNPLPAGEHKIIGTYVNQFEANATVPANTFFTLDQTTLSCPKPTCTLWMTMMQQVGAPSGSGRWAVNVNVDGTTVNGAVFQGFIPPSNFAVGNWQGEVSVTQGTHTVTFQTYGEVAYVAPFWADSASVMKP